MTPEQEILEDALIAARLRTASFATDLRNSFAHDYSSTFAQIVPLLNRAWVFAPVLLATIDRVAAYVAENDLLGQVEIK